MRCSTARRGIAGAERLVGHLRQRGLVGGVVQHAVQFGLLAPLGRRLQLDRPLLEPPRQINGLLDPRGVLGRGIGAELRQERDQVFVLIHGCWGDCPNFRGGGGVAPKKIYPAARAPCKAWSGLSPSAAASRKGTGPCFRSRTGWPTQRGLAEKWTSPRTAREKPRLYPSLSRNGSGGSVRHGIAPSTTAIGGAG